MAQSDLNCLHQHYLTNGVHKLILQSGSEGAIDDALVHLKRILAEHPIDEPLKILVDARKGVPPLRYSIAKLREFYSNCEQLPHIRAAYIYEDSIVLSILQLFFKGLRMKASRRFIKGGTDIEALEWIVSDEYAGSFTTSNSKA